jgi:hypothetical protein
MVDLCSPKMVQVRIPDRDAEILGFVWTFAPSVLLFAVDAERIIVLHVARQPTSEQGRSSPFQELKLFQE